MSAIDFNMDLERETGGLMGMDNSIKRPSHRATIAFRDAATSKR